MICVLETHTRVCLHKRPGLTSSAAVVVLFEPRDAAADSVRAHHLAERQARRCRGKQNLNTLRLRPIERWVSRTVECDRALSYALWWANREVFLRYCPAWVGCRLNNVQVPNVTNTQRHQEQRKHRMSSSNVFERLELVCLQVFFLKQLVDEPTEKAWRHRRKGPTHPG